MAKIIFLGTSGAVASKERDNSSFLIKTKNELILIDCPGSLVSKLAKLGINFCKLSKIFFTHQHPDHIYGIVSLLHSQYRLKNKLHLYASLETLRLIKDLRRLFSLEDTELYPQVIFHPLKQSNPVFYNSKELVASFFKTKHTKNSVGFKIFFKKRGKKLIISGDTAFNYELIEEAKESDFLIHDCFCPERFFKKYPQLYQKHTSSLQLGRIASLSKTETLIPIHFSSELKYNFSEIIKEIRKYYSGKIIIPEDLMELNI